MYHACDIRHVQSETWPACAVHVACMRRVCIMLVIHDAMRVRHVCAMHGSTRDVHVQVRGHVHVHVHMHVRVQCMRRACSTHVCTCTVYVPCMHWQCCKSMALLALPCIDAVVPNTL